MDTPPNNPTQTSTKTILLLGSSGFIGKQVVKQLSYKGYTLRTPSHNEIDFINPNWKRISELLQGIDMVINMVGIMSQDKQILKQVHYDTPKKLAKLAKKFHVKRWVNLSALGVDPNHKVAFVASKAQGDDALLALADNNFSIGIARPSLVFGRGGASCEMFLNLAHMPLLALPNGGMQSVQPVHVMDVTQGLVNLVLLNHLNETKRKNLANVINFTGAEVCSIAAYLTMMRTDIHKLAPPTIVSIPQVIVRSSVMMFTSLIPSKYKSMINKDSLILLNQNSIADNRAFTQLLGRQPLGYTEFSHYY